MVDYVKEWLEGRGESFLQDIGIKEGDTVLDFGCGLGNYTIPAAKIVKGKGRVYALDKDKRSLDKLMRKAESMGLKNIIRMDTSGEVGIRLDDESVDVILLYDIFWYFPLSDPRLTKLLVEIYRVAKCGALISVLPKHIDAEKLKDKIESTGFHLENRYRGIIIHDNILERGQVLNFVKRCESINR